MASERLRIARGVKIVNGRAYGPGIHDIKDREIARQLRARGATRIVGKGTEETEVDASAPESVDELTGDIPEKFPYRKALADNNITTLDALVAKNREELIQMDGIAELAADKIQQALEDLVVELQDEAAKK